MAALILPRRISSQPQGSLSIDSGNQITRGLVLCAPMGNATALGARDIVQSNFWTPLGTGTTDVGPNGRVISGFGWQNAASVATLAPGDFTVVLLARASSPAATQVWFSGGATSGEWVGTFGGNWTLTAGAISTASVNSSKDQLVVATLSAGTKQIYVDGVAGISFSGTGSFASGTTTLGDFGPGGGFAASGYVGFLAVFNRALSASEIASISANPWQVVASPPRRIWAAVASTGTVPLTGVSTTGSVGTAGVTHAQALTGSSSTGSPGTVVPTRAGAVTAVTGTGSPGAVVPALTIGLTGNSATGTPGSVTVAGGNTFPLTGVSSTVTAGTLAPGAAVALAGVTGATAPGSVTALVSKLLTGNTGAGSVGALSTNTVIALSGVSSAGAAGNVTVQTSNVTIALTGVTAAGSVGTLTADGGDVSVQYAYWLGQHRKRRWQLEKAAQQERELLEQAQAEEQVIEQAIQEAPTKKSAMAARAKLNDNRLAQAKITILAKEIEKQIRAEADEADDVEVIQLFEAHRQAQIHAIMELLH